MDPHFDPRTAGRDRDLHRLSRLSRGIGVSALGLMGLIAGYVWQAKPGHATAKLTARKAAPGIPAAAPVPKLNTGGAAPAAPPENLSPPPQPPAPASVPSPVTSGGS